MNVLTNGSGENMERYYSTILSAIAVSVVFTAVSNYITKHFYIQKAGLNFSRMYLGFLSIFEAQGPWASQCIHLLGGGYSTSYWPGKEQVWGPFTNEEVRTPRHSSYTTTPPVSVWIPSSRRWLLSSRTAPEDQSFTTSATINPLHLSTLVSVVVYHCIDWWLWKCFQEWGMFECWQKCG